MWEKCKGFREWYKEYSAKPDQVCNSKPTVKKMRVAAINSLATTEHKNVSVESLSEVQTSIEHHRKAARHHEQAAKRHHEAADQQERNFEIKTQMKNA